MPSKNYPQKLTTQRQKSFESNLSSTLMQVKLVISLKTNIIVIAKLSLSLIWSKLILSGLNINPACEGSG